MDTESLKTFLSATLRRLLKPIVRIALRGELTYREFADIAKLAYFEVARDDYGINGRKTNLARVAILTGLSRKECTRLKSLTSDAAAPAAPIMSPATRVITAWHETPEYLDSAGNPLPLPASGPAPSLEDLLRRFGGDIPDGALMTELRRLGAVEEGEDERFRVLRRSFIADGFSQDRIRILGNLLGDLGATIVHNLDESNVDDLRIARYVVADAVPPEVAHRFQALAQDRGQALLTELDHWLNTGRQPDTDAIRQGQRVGLGLYFFQEPADTTTNSTSSGDQQ